MRTQARQNQHARFLAVYQKPIAANMALSPGGILAFEFVVPKPRGKRAIGLKITQDYRQFLDWCAPSSGATQVLFELLYVLYFSHRP